jgi:hypothetical protein
VIGLALGVMQSDQPDSAPELADSVTEPLDKIMIWSAAGADSYDADPERTLERLARAEIPDELQKIMIEKWQERIDNKAKRNAQNLASVYSAAVAAGADFQGKTPAELAAEIVSGITGSDSFSTTRFQVPNMAETEIERALRHLSATDGGMNYDPDPPQR